MRWLTRLISLFLLIVLALSNCKEEEKKEFLQFDGLKERRIEWSSSIKYNGFIIGASVEKKEVYIENEIQENNQHHINIVDIVTGKIKRTIALPVGSFESPTEFFNPSLMNYLAGKYYIIDQYHKILVYNEQLEYLYTHMFHNIRVSIDFFTYDQRIFFVIGEKKFGYEYRGNHFNIYELRENSRPEKFRELVAYNFLSDRRKMIKDQKNDYSGEIWPSGRGFEKDGKIYTAESDDNDYSVHIIKDNRTITVNMDYLKPKKFSREAYEKYGKAKREGYIENLKKRNRGYILEEYPDPLYQFGIYDVGKDKIGIIGDLDLDNIKCRLDILEASQGKYLESIWLPFGSGLRENMSGSSRGMSQTVIDVDNGYYLWYNEEGEDLTSYVYVNKFKIIRPDIPQNHP